MENTRKNASLPLLFAIMIAAAAPKDVKAFGMLEGALIGAGVGAVVGLVMSLAKKKPAETAAAPMEKSSAPQDSVQTAPNAMPPDSTKHF